MGAFIVAKKLNVDANHAKNSWLKNWSAISSVPLSATWVCLSAYLNVYTNTCTFESACTSIKRCTLMSLTYRVCVVYVNVCVYFMYTSVTQGYT